MLYWLTQLSDGGDFFNLFRYITFRAGGAFFTALLFGFIFGRPLINVLRKKQGKGQPIRDDGPTSHLIKKKGTPTMGGVLIIVSVLLSIIMWARWDQPILYIMIFSLIWFAGLGFLDDYRKLTKRQSLGSVSYTHLTLPTKA